MPASSHRATTPDWPVLTTEWIPSDSIPALLASAAAMNLVTAMSVLPRSAAKMTFLDDDAMDRTLRIVAEGAGHPVTGAGGI